MSRQFCPRETEVLDLLRAGQWPDCCSDELSSHLTSCAMCAETVAVAAAVLFDHDAAMHEAHVPASGLVWWRSQRRMRQDAERKAMRAVTAVQALTVGVAVVIVAAVLGAVVTIDWSWLIQWTIPLIVAGVACATLAPVAIYFAVAKD